MVESEACITGATDALKEGCYQDGLAGRDAVALQLLLCLSSQD